MLLLDLLLNHIGLVLDLVDLLRSAAVSLNFRHGAFPSPPTATEATMFYRPSVFAGCSGVQKNQFGTGGHPALFPPQVQSTLRTATQLLQYRLPAQDRKCLETSQSLLKLHHQAEESITSPHRHPRRERETMYVFFSPMVVLFKQIVYVSLNSAAAVRSILASGNGGS